MVTIPGVEAYGTESHILQGKSAFWDHFRQTAVNHPQRKGVDLSVYRINGVALTNKPDTYRDEGFQSRQVTLVLPKETSSEELSGKSDKDEAVHDEFEETQ